MSLGAGYTRLARQCLVEGLVLAALGAAAGVVVGRFGLQILLALRPDSLSRLASARVDTTVLAFAIATATLWGLLFSMAPLVEVFRTDLATTLQQEGRRVGGARALPYAIRVVVCRSR